MVDRHRSRSRWSPLTRIRFIETEPAVQVSRPALVSKRRWSRSTRRQRFLCGVFVRLDGCSSPPLRVVWVLGKGFQRQRLLRTSFYCGHSIFPFESLLRRADRASVLDDWGLGSNRLFNLGRRRERGRSVFLSSLLWL